MVGPVVVAGAGAAAAIVGVALHQAGQSSYDDVRSACPAGACSSQSATDQGNSGRSQMIAGDVILAAGLASIVAGATWWLVAPRRAATMATLDLEPLRGGGHAKVIVRW
jgi:hypothetical protein